MRILGLVLAAAMFALTACGNGSDEAAETTTGPGTVDLQIQEPTDGKTTRRSEISVSGTVAAGSEVSVNGLVAATVDTDGNDDSKYFAVPVSLRLGKNTIQVKATREGADSEEETLTVTRKAKKKRTSKPKPPPAPSSPKEEEKSEPEPAPEPEQEEANCDPNYEGACIPPYPPDLDCPDIPESDFSSVGSDPHGFDRDKDGVACES